MLNAQTARVRQRLQQAADDQHDAVAMTALQALPGPFLPWTPYSMRPSAILAVLSDIAINARELVVECGSGNSTVYAARLFQQRGVGTVVTIDHDAEWAQRTVEQLETEGLSEFAQVVVAPLANGWYAHDAIPDLRDIGLLVVDGPPANAPGLERARAGAITYFQPRLTPNSTVILDDARRAHELSLVDEWSRSTGRPFRVERGGYAISAPHFVG